MKRFVLLFLTWLWLLPLTAQVLNPAHWSYSARALSNDEVELTLSVQLDAGWHIYSQHSSEGGPIALQVTFEESDGYVRLGAMQEPKPHEEMDEVFGVVVRSFEGTVKFRQKIRRRTDKEFVVRGSLYYQLCNEGSCIAPDDVPFAVKVPAAKEAASGQAQPDTQDTPDAPDRTEPATLPEGPNGTVGTTGTDQPVETNASDGLWAIFFGALGFGVITMFTPCVFPMIPMTVNYFMHGNENKRKSRRQARFFGLSIVFIFTVLGALLSLFFGPDVLNLVGTHGVTNLIFFAVFFIFALSFFGLFEIKMPERWVNKSDEQADKGGWLAPFFIALTTVLISFSCTGPIIGGALVGFATSVANRWVALLTMLGFGIGFALPFTLLAMFPSMVGNMKSGGWMNAVKVVFAFLELAFGLKFLQMADLYWGWHLLDREVYLALWIVIFGLTGLYLLGKIRFKGDEKVEHIGVVRLMLAIVTLSFTVYMVPGMWGAPLNAIAGFLPPMDTQDFNIERTVMEHGGTRSNSEARLPADRKYADRLHLPAGFEGFYDIEEAKEYARTQGKPVFIDFTGRNCANCREMEQVAWADARARKLLNEEFVICALYADMNDIELPEAEWLKDANGRTVKTLGRRNLHYQIEAFNQNAQPCYVVVDCDGRQVSPEVYVYDPKRSASGKADSFVEFLERSVAAFKDRTGKR